MDLALLEIMLSRIRNQQTTNKMYQNNKYDKSPNDM